MPAAGLPGDNSCQGLNVSRISKWGASEAGRGTILGMERVRAIGLTIVGLSMATYFAVDSGGWLRWPVVGCWTWTAIEGALRFRRLSRPLPE